MKNMIYRCSLTFLRDSLVLFKNTKVFRYISPFAGNGLKNILLDYLGLRTRFQSYIN